MSNDIKSILERMAVLEGKITPVSVKHGLNPQQKSVHQLPALFKPRDISTVLKSKTDPEHPMKGELVGDSVEPKQNALEEAMGEIEEDSPTILISWQRKCLMTAAVIETTLRWTN